jgi:hypothetical protein
MPLITYEARVAAVGPSGSASSPWSNQFAISGPCTYSASINTQSFAATGGSGTVGVTTGSSCTWSATSGAGWATPSSPTGTGNGTVGFTVSPNTSSQSRSTVLTVASQSLSITQSGVACTFTLSALSQAIAAAGGSGSVGITAPDGCAWNAVSSAPWLVAGAGGSGAGTAAYSASANTTAAARTATLTVAGTAVAVTQAAAANLCGVAPTVTITPDPVWVVAGPDDLVYKVKVLNNDNSACGKGSFVLASALPAGWMGKLDSITVSANPGSTGQTNFHVTEPSTTVAGAYPVVVTAMPAAGGSVVSDTAIENIVTNLGVTTAAGQSVYLRGQSASLTTTVMAGPTPANGARVTVQVLRPDGSLFGSWSGNTNGSGVWKANVSLATSAPVGGYVVRTTVVKESAQGSATASFTVQ